MAFIHSAVVKYNYCVVIFDWWKRSKHVSLICFEGWTKYRIIMKTHFNSINVNLFYAL